MEEVGYRISWRWMGELGGVQLSGFGASKKRRLSASRQEGEIANPVTTPLRRGTS
jgi:hypothetical protein